MNKIFNPVFFKMSIIEMDDILRTPYLMDTCRRLSLGPGYGMNRCLDRYSQIVQQRSVDATGVIAFYQNIPIGWLLYTYEHDCMSFIGYNGEAACHLYVDGAWRRLGIGTKLLHLAVRMADPDTLRVYAHENEAFFNPIINKNQNVAAVI